MSNKRKLMVLSHTHWDREWYLPFQELRLKLIALVDELLNILTADPEYRFFMLDGQTVVLEDYLALRPENRALLSELIQAGRLLVGPWYILPDEFLVSGESLVRNLLIGHDIAKGFGATMEVGYLPDQFGHIAQMPQILRGFGLDAAMVWRGVGEEITTSEFLWRAPDGSDVLTLHLPVGYFNMPVLPEDPKELVNQLHFWCELLGRYASTEYLVLMNGCDHGFPQRHTPRVIAAANALMSDAQIEHTTLPRLVEQVRQAIERQGIVLPIASGELRNSKRAHLLPGVLSARTWVKQRNVVAEGLLEHWAEPFTAWARLTSKMEDPRAALRLAWQSLLQNQPHDSVCGCSVDQVHDEMRTRFAATEQIGASLAREALQAIAANVDTSTLPTVRAPAGASDATGGSRTDTPVLVFNPGSGPRTDYVSLPAWLPLAGESVLLDSNGRVVPFQAEVDDDHDLLSAGLNRPALQDALSRLRSDYVPDPTRQLVRIGFVARDVPSFGYRTYVLAQRAATVPAPSLAQGQEIANEFFVAQADPANGTVTITDRATGRRYEGLNRFVDSGDSGDEYNFNPPENDLVVVGPAGRVEVSVPETGPCKAILRLAGAMSLPVGLSPDRKSRSKEQVSCSFVVDVVLYPGVRRIEFRTQIDNRALDHRLRVHFPTNVATEWVTAETQFGVARRPIGKTDGGEGWVEEPVPTQPQKSFVHIDNGRDGLMLINRGLPEYEAIPTEDGTELALTLLRCVGWLSRDDLRSRWGHAGPPMPTPGAQNPGPQIFAYALVPGARHWDEALPDAHWFNQPLQAMTADWHAGNLPSALSFIEVEPQSLVVSTVKVPEKEEGLIVRLYNPTAETVTGKIKVAFPFTEVALTNLEETGRMALPHDGQSVGLAVRSAQIVTLRFTFDR